MFVYLSNTALAKMQRRIHQHRRGLATIELAITLPVVVAIVFGAIEAASFIQLRHVLTQAGYEGAKLISTDTQEIAEQRTRDILDARKIQGYTLTINPPLTPSTVAGTTMRVTIQAPANGNSFGITNYFRNRTIQVTFTTTRL
jgi:Flp pilus assembly protein TadG